jgi:hypothetical protein
MVFREAYIIIIMRRHWDKQLAMGTVSSLSRGTLHLEILFLGQV